MPEIQKISVALTAEQVGALKSAVDSGEYATTSEIVREALRQWQRGRDLHQQELNRLRALWQEGKASGAAAPLDLVRTREKARQKLKKAAERVA